MTSPWLCTQIEALVTGAGVLSDDLPPEVVELEALLALDSADLEPPDIDALRPPRQGRKRK